MSASGVSRPFRTNYIMTKSDDGHSSAEASIGLICHLIELFLSHVHVQQAPILLVENIVMTLKDGTCTPPLCFAMCSASIKYLVHQEADMSPNRALRAFFATKARQYIRGGHWSSSLQRLQAHCVLVLREMHEANGSEAWIELCMHDPRGSLFSATNDPQLRPKPCSNCFRLSRKTTYAYRRV